MSSSEELEGVKPCLSPDGEESKEEENGNNAPASSAPGNDNESSSSSKPAEITDTPPQIQLDGAVVSAPEHTVQHLPTEDLPDGRAESEITRMLQSAVSNLVGT